MNIETTTVNVVKTWSGFQEDLDERRTLQSLGSLIGGTFYPDLCQDLLTKLLAAFPQYPNLKNDLTLVLFYDSQNNATGTIKTVQQLVSAIDTSTATPFMRFMSAIKAPFRFMTRNRKR
jgi:hypothetical protein